MIILWGSNARETHPIFFHHLLRGVRNGARLVAVDPRRTSSAEWADVWLGIDVGSDISLANAMAREIIHNELADKEFIARATTGYDEVARCVEAYTLDRADADFPSHKGWHLSEMFEAMDRGELSAVYIVGENPARSEADQTRAVRLLSGLDHLVVQDIFLTQTAELAHVVLPAAAGWAESEGTVTNSERRVQRVRRALEPPAGARDDIDIMCDLARRLGCDWGNPTAEQVWDECRSLSPMHAGMAYSRLAELGGIQWPCPDESHPGTQFLHARLWQEPVEGPRAPFHAVENDPPVDKLSDEFPIRLTTGRRLDSFNTGVQTGEYTSPLRRGEALLISPEDGKRYGVGDGERVRASSRRGSVEVDVRFEPSLRPGLAFMTLHFPDQVATNVLTIDATDPKSGTAEVKASAIRIDKRPVRATP